MIKNKLLELDIFIENEYFNRYVDLISNAIGRQYIKSKTQKHHIVPRSYYKENNLPLDDTVDNKVNLFHYEHILAHWYLYKCAKTDYFIYANCYALLYMLRINNLPESEEDLITQAINYGEVYTDFCHRQSLKYKGKSPGNKGKKVSPELRQKLSNAHKGKKRSEESLRKQSETLKNLWQTKWQNREISDEVKKRTSDSVKRLIYIHKEDITKHIKPEELDTYLQDGWVLGTSDLFKEKASKHFREYNKNRIFTDETRKKMSEAAKNRDKSTYPRANKGKIRITDGSSRKFINSDELDYYINNGWRRDKKQ